VDRTEFVFTIFFMLLGPLKVFPGFLKATRGKDSQFKRTVAFKAFVISALIVAAVALLGQGLLQKYQISLDALRLACGLVLLISALRAMFPSGEAPSDEAATPTATQVAISPMAMPVIVTPAGIASVLIFGMVAPKQPGMQSVILWTLALILAFDLLAMLVADWVVKIPGFMLALLVLGSVIVFIQVALAIETLVVALRSLGVVT